MLFLLPACACIYVLNLVSMIFVTTIPISFNISMEMFYTVISSSAIILEPTALIEVILFLVKMQLKYSHLTQ